MKNEQYDYCLVCGRRLKNPEYRLIGVGPECQRKLTDRKSKLKLFKIRKADNEKY